MISFDKPQNLNGKELIEELKKGNVVVNGFPFLDENNQLWLDIDAKDKNKAQLIVSAHNGTLIAAELTITEKLASVGLSIEELKAALGV